MTTTTQQIPSNPALEFANSILEVTNNGLELIEILRDIAQDTDEVASTNDRIAATNILNDRAFGKSPRQITPSAGPNPDPTPETDANAVEPAPYSIRGALREAPPAVSHNEPESPRLVTRVDESLNRSLGPAPSASQHTPQTPDSFDPNSIHFTIQQHILAITNNGQMLRDILLEIARACPEPVEGAEDDPEASPEHEPALSKSKGRRITPYHRRRAVSILLDRALGADPALIRNGPCPEHKPALSMSKPVLSKAEGGRTIQDDAQEQTAPDPKWLEALAKIQQMKDEGILTPDPNAPEIDHSYYMKGTEEEIRPYAAEVVAKYRADLELRTERRKQWPEIEERRRKKLAEIYPSHSEDGGPPDI